VSELFFFLRVFFDYFLSLGKLAIMQFILSDPSLDVHRRGGMMDNITGALLISRGEYLTEDPLHYGRVLN